MSFIKLNGNFYDCHGKRVYSVDEENVREGFSLEHKLKVIEEAEKTNEIEWYSSKDFITAFYKEVYSLYENGRLVYGSKTSNGVMLNDLQLLKHKSCTVIAFQGDIGVLLGDVLIKYMNMAYSDKVNCIAERDDGLYLVTESGDIQIL